MQRLLTSREFEVAKLVARGKTNRAIAACLCVSQRTVENHLYSIYSKVGVKTRTELAFIMYRHDDLQIAV
jgi:DNA-binding NarL/FixJ family response regulator